MFLTLTNGCPPHSPRWAIVTFFMNSAKSIALSIYRCSLIQPLWSTVFGLTPQAKAYFSGHVLYMVTPADSVTRHTAAQPAMIRHVSVVRA